MIYKLKIDGSNQIPLDATVAENDDLLRTTIGAAMPELANATIQRHPPLDGVVVIELVKRAGHKGSAPLAPLALLAGCAGGINPAQQLWQEVQNLDAAGLTPEALLLLDGQIRQALQAGQAQATAMDRARRRLLAAPPVAAPFAVML